MPIETTLLLWSIILGLLQCAATGLALMSQRGLGFTAGARDDQKPVGGLAGRVIRAFHNFRETYVFFAVLVLAAQLLNRHSALTAIGAQLYFWARIAYWPLYVGGVFMLRSLVWLVSVLGIILLLIGVAQVIR